MLRIISATLILISLMALGYRATRVGPKPDELRELTRPINAATGAYSDVPRLPSGRSVDTGSTSVEDDKAELHRVILSADESQKSRTRSILLFQTKHSDASGIAVLIEVFPLLKTDDDKRVAALSILMAETDGNVQKLIDDASISENSKIELRTLIKRTIDGKHVDSEVKP